jgi:hypothetical protein
VPLQREKEDIRWHLSLQGHFWKGRFFLHLALLLIFFTEACIHASLIISDSSTYLEQYKNNGKHLSNETKMRINALVHSPNHLESHLSQTVVGERESSNLGEKFDSWVHRRLSQSGGQRERESVI